MFLYMGMFTPGEHIQTAVFMSQGKLLHTRHHNSEIPLENATEGPLDISSKIHWESDNPLENTTDTTCSSAAGAGALRDVYAGGFTPDPRSPPTSKLVKS